jgi:hypothetical protein
MNLLVVGILCAFDFAQSNNPWKEESERAHIENIDRISANSLLHFRKWEYSQFGEDGIIEEIFKRIGIENGFYVEFGAGDGVWISNTYSLFKKGWKGFLIEADTSKKYELRKNFPEGCGVNFCNEFVTWKKEDKRGRLFDEIAQKYFPFKEIDFLSIDIDSGDLYILKSLKRRPKVICIECGMGWHPLQKKEAPESVALNLANQNPIEAHVQIAKQMGYTPVTYNVINLFLVRDDYAYLFSEITNDTVSLYKDSFRLLAKRDRDCLFSRRNDVKSYEESDFDRQMPITLDF